MRNDPRRLSAVALVTLAALAIGSTAMPAARAQGLQLGRDRGNSGGPGMAPKPFGNNGGSSAAPKPDQGAAAPQKAGEMPIKAEAIPVDTTPLARYVPADAAFFVEFPGLGNAVDLYRASNVGKLLNETILGVNLKPLIAQAISAAPAGSTGPMTGPEVASIVGHIVQHGFVVASPMDPARDGGDYTVLVLRNAAHKEARAVFGKLLGSFKADDAKPSVGDRGGRKVVSMGPMGAGEQGEEWSWWIEGNDVVLILEHSSGADPVIAAIDGTAPSLTNEPIRAELMAADGTFTPVLFGAFRFDKAGAEPRQFAEAQGHQRATIRMGFDGEATLTVVNLDAPAPRKGFLTVFDQQTFTLDQLPPVPAGVEQLTVGSVNFVALFNAAMAAANQASPGAGTKAATAIDEAIREVAVLDIREDILAKLGPKVAIFTMPESGAGGGSNPLAALAGIVGKYAVAVELQDGADFNGTLSALVNAANKRLDAYWATLYPPPDEDEKEDGKKSKPPEGPRFAMTLPDPLTYSLKLPQGLYAITGLMPTITMGTDYLYIAMTPAQARELRELEKPATGGARWSPDPRTTAALGRVPGGLIGLAVSDPSRTLPDQLAALPAILRGEAVAMPGRGPGDPGGGRPSLSRGLASGGGSGSSSSGGDSAASSGESIDYGLSSGGSSSGSSSSGPPPGATPAAAAPELVPPAETLRRYLFPATYTVSVSDAGIRVEAFESLPGQWALSLLGAAPMAGMMANGTAPAAAPPGPGGYGSGRRDEPGPGDYGQSSGGASSGASSGAIP